MTYRNGRAGEGARSAPAGLHGQYWLVAKAMLADRTANATEPDVLVPVLGLVPVPVRRAQVPGLVVERTAAEHPPPVLMPACLSLFLMHGF
jgi:hypothetical protein